MRAIFTEKQQEGLIAHDGYVVIDFLSSNELETVKKTIPELGYAENNDAKLWFSTTQETVDRKNEIYEKFYPVLQRATDRFLQDHKLIRIVVINKFPGGEAVKPHQHPNRVDESKYRSLTAWLPLTDTTVEIGTLHVVKSSHTIFVQHLRPYNDFTMFHNITPRVLGKYSIPLLLKAGQIVIFDDRLIHWSPPNKTSSNRMVIQFDLLPREIETDLTIYYRDNKDELSEYKINPKTYRESALSHEKPDDLLLLGRKKQPKYKYNNRQFIAMMKAAHSENTKKNINFFQRLFQ